MNVKKLIATSAWVFLSAIFFVGPLLLSKGIIPDWTGLPISLIPCIAIVTVTLSRLTSLHSKSFLLISASTALYWLHKEDHLQPDLIFLSNVTLINGLLFWVFARTLAPGSIPLCTRFAALVHDVMSKEVASYTRGLTFAWSVFFAMQAILWITLYILLPESSWYQLVTIVPPALITTLFGLDWIARQYLLPYEDRKDALQLTFKALIKHCQGLGKSFSK